MGQDEKFELNVTATATAREYADLGLYCFQMQNLLNVLRNLREDPYYRAMTDRVVDESISSLISLVQEEFDDSVALYTAIREHLTTK